MIPDDAECICGHILADHTYIGGLCTVKVGGGVGGGGHSLCTCGGFIEKLDPEDPR